MEARLYASLEPCLASSRMSDASCSEVSSDHPAPVRSATRGMTSSERSRVDFSHSAWFSQWS